MESPEMKSTPKSDLSPFLIIIALTGLRLVALRPNNWHRYQYRVEKRLEQL